MFEQVLNTTTLGYGDKKVDYNYKCIRENNIEKNFGFKIYEFKKDGSKILLHLPFFKDDKEHGYPDSEVKYWGSQTLSGVKYDHVQMWFRHMKKPLDGGYFLFRYILRIKGNEVSLDAGFFGSNKDLAKKTNKIDESVEYHIDSDHDKVANYLRSYYEELEKYVKANSKEKFISTKIYKCSLN